MKRIAEIIGQSLSWGQPSALKMEYELRAGDDLVATLRFRSSFGSFATGQSAGGCWTFKRVGFWQTRATIRECDADAEVGNFRNNTWHGGGTLELEGGRQFLVTSNFWQTKLEFQDEAGSPLIQFRSRGIVHLGADLEIQPQAARTRELELLILFGWYLTVMMHMDSAGVTAGGAGAG